MRVILPGNKNRLRWGTRVFCNGQGLHVDGGCGALLEIEGGDLFLQNVDLDAHRSTCVMAIECPECGTLTSVEKVPEVVRKTVLAVRTAPPSRSQVEEGVRRHRAERII